MMLNIPKLESPTLRLIRLLLGVLLLLYVCLVVLPFYGNGIDHYSLTMDYKLREGPDSVPGPDNFPPFILHPILGPILRITAILLAIYGPYLLGILTILLSLMIPRTWQARSRQARIRDVSLILIAIGLVFFVLTLQGQLVAKWMMD